MVEELVGREDAVGMDPDAVADAIEPALREVVTRLAKPIGEDGRERAVDQSFHDAPAGGGYRRPGAHGVRRSLRRGGAEDYGRVCTRAGKVQSARGDQ